MVVRIRIISANNNFNFATNIQMGVYNNHEISLGFNISEYLGKGE